MTVVSMSARIIHLRSQRPAGYRNRWLRETRDISADRGFWPFGLTDVTRKCHLQLERREKTTKRKAAMRHSPKHTMLEPTARAMNCCPPDAKVIGEVLMVAFSGTRHSVLPSRSSTATK